jgi:hypothetical protein
MSLDRACRARRTCPCPHSACYDGWLDRDLVVTHRGRRYVAVARCPTCWGAWLARVAT